MASIRVFRVLRGQSRGRAGVSIAPFEETRRYPELEMLAGQDQRSGRFTTRSVVAARRPAASTLTR